MPLILHTWQLASMQGRKQRIASNRGLGVILRCHTSIHPGGGSNQQPADSQTTALTPQVAVKEQISIITQTPINE